MKRLSLLTSVGIVVGFLTLQASHAQQSPSQTQPQQKQVVPAPCSAPVLPKRVHAKLPAFLQKQIDRQQARLGGMIDVNGVIQDATGPKPCPPTPVPSPAAPTSTQPIPKQ